VPFNFNEGCFRSWEKLKQELISTPIISALNWTKLFEIMCDASDLAIGAILGQRINNQQRSTIREGC